MSRQIISLVVATIVGLSSIAFVSTNAMAYGPDSGRMGPNARYNPGGVYISSSRELLAQRVSLSLLTLPGDLDHRAASRYERQDALGARAVGVAVCALGKADCVCFCRAFFALKFQAFSCGKRRCATSSQIACA